MLSLWLTCISLLLAMFIFVPLRHLLMEHGLVSIVTGSKVSGGYWRCRITSKNEAVGIFFCLRQELAPFQFIRGETDECCEHVLCSPDMNEWNLTCSNRMKLKMTICANSKMWYLQHLSLFCYGFSASHWPFVQLQSISSSSNRILTISVF